MSLETELWELIAKHFPSASQARLTLELTTSTIAVGAVTWQRCEGNAPDVESIRNVFRAHYLRTQKMRHPETGAELVDYILRDSSEIRMVLGLPAEATGGGLFDDD